MAERVTVTKVCQRDMAKKDRRDRLRLLIVREEDEEEELEERDERQ